MNTMQKTLLALSLALALTGCKSEAEQHADYIKNCAVYDFTPKQCEFLYTLEKRQSTDTGSDNMMSSMAVGIAIGSASSNR